MSEFDGDVSAEALAAWERYQATPTNHRPTDLTPEMREQDAFTAGFDAASNSRTDLDIPGFEGTLEALSQLTIRKEG